MTTLKAIEFILKTKKRVKLLSIDSEIKYSYKTNDITLLVNGGHIVSINECVEINTIAIAI